MKKSEKMKEESDGRAKYKRMEREVKEISKVIKEKILISN